MKKLARWTLIALIVWWVIQDPVSAGHAIRAVGGTLSHAARSLSSLTSGH